MSPQPSSVIAPMQRIMVIPSSRHVVPQLVSPSGRSILRPQPVSDSSTTSSVTWVMIEPPSSTSMVGRSRKKPVAIPPSTQAMGSVTTRGSR